MSSRYRQWAEKVEGQLEGSTVEDLATAIDDGLEVQVLYPEKLPPHDRWGLPGVPPFTRGSRDANSAGRGCVFCPEHQGSDLESFQDLWKVEEARDAGGVWLRLRGTPALEAASANEGTKALFRSLIGSGKTLFLDAGSATHPVALQLLKAFGARESSPQILAGCLGHDPLGAFFGEGQQALDLDKEYQQMRELVGACRQMAMVLRAVMVSTRSYHEAGANEAQELAYAVATGTEYVRRLGAEGVPWRESAAQIVFSFAVGGRFFLEIAKLRAARLLWSKVGAAAGMAIPPVIHARTSRRSKTSTHLRGNLVRSSVEAAAAILGGVEFLTVAPYDELVDESTPEGHRLAANTNLILSQEAGLQRVTDPGGGSAYLEEITEELARRAWELFQAIEGVGGMGAAVQGGEIARQLGESATDKDKKQGYIEAPESSRE